MPTNVNISVPTYALADVPELPTYDAQIAAIDVHIENMKAFRAKLYESKQSTAAPTVPYTGPDDPTLATDWADVLAKDVTVYGEEWDPTIGTVGP